MVTVTAPVLSPIYLGSSLPRWQPRSLVEVQAAIANGTLTEGHWLDAKERLDGGPSANAELARDLASFANDGGALLIGVAENRTNRAFSLAPVGLAGLPERIDQVARARCDPPLYVTCHPIEDPSDTTQGVLIVEVPPSPQAPHMVDGQYFGRGDTTKHRLSDAEVTRLHARRTARQLTGEQLIAREIERSPVLPEHKRLSHLYVVAQPLASPPDLVTSLIGKRELWDLVLTTHNALPKVTDVTPDLTWTGRYEPRARGAGFRCDGTVGRRFDPGRTTAGEDQQIDLEIADDGTVTLFYGRGSLAPWEGEGIGSVYEPGIVGLTRVVVGVAGALGGARGYAGRWLLAIGVDWLQGRYSGHSHGNLGGAIYPPFSENDYIQTTEAATVELLDRPGGVTNRLLNRLLRGLNTPVTIYNRWLSDGA